MSGRGEEWEESRKEMSGRWERVSEREIGRGKRREVEGYSWEGRKQGSSKREWREQECKEAE